MNNDKLLNADLEISSVDNVVNNVDNVKLSDFFAQNSPKWPDFGQKWPKLSDILSPSQIFMTQSVHSFGFAKCFYLSLCCLLKVFETKIHFNQIFGQKWPDFDQILVRF